MFDSSKYKVYFFLMLFLSESQIWAQNSPSSSGEASPSSAVDSNSPKEGTQPIDYRNFSHTVFIEMFRGGSYEKQGFSRYYFKAAMNATKAGKGDGEDTKKVTTPIGTFGELSLKSLDIWKRDDKTKGGSYELRIDGDLIRETVARAMLEWLIPESEVIVSVDLELWRHAKKFGLLGEDARIADAKYQLVPKISEATGQSPEIVMSDDKGVMVRLATKFDRVGLVGKEKKEK